jgi:hypothetical protein
MRLPEIRKLTGANAREKKEVTDGRLMAVTIQARRNDRQYRFN